MDSVRFSLKTASVYQAICNHFKVTEEICEFWSKMVDPGLVPFYNAKETIDLFGYTLGFETDYALSQEQTDDEVSSMNDFYQKLLDNIRRQAEEEKGGEEK